MRWFLTALVFAAPSAPAETPMTSGEFDAFTRGKTLTYSDSGRDFGAEEYLDNQRVRWTFLDGDCVEGKWYTAGEMICFVYETMDAHQCWTFFARADGIMARFENNPDLQPVYQTRESREPLVCLGPKVGV